MAQPKSQSPSSTQHLKTVPTEHHQLAREANAVWEGGLRDGEGRFSTASPGLLDVPYSYRSRFESRGGTNPEELIGAAHAGCFSMALSAELTKAGLRPERIRTNAYVSFDQVGGAWTITGVRLETRARVPGADPDAFRRIAESAKTNCPVSRVLKADIRLDAELE